ncbi:MAG TPA: cytochrome c [Caulobacteraceae bacterium]|nr:cytochrome c [Caulobacteraceae bacterium]
MRRWLIPFLCGAAAVAVLMAVGGLVVVEAGLFDARASTPHSPLVAWAAHTAMIHDAQRSARAVAPPAAFTPAQTLAGFRLYDQHCVACHGAPGVARQAWTEGMTPSPPYLVDAPRHWTRGELYWIVSNGVKMTGMPAWSAVHSPGELWQIVAFLEAQPYLTTRDYAALRAANPPSAGQP